MDEFLYAFMYGGYGPNPIFPKNLWLPTPEKVRDYRRRCRGSVFDTEFIKQHIKNILAYNEKALFKMKLLVDLKEWKWEEAEYVCQRVSPSGIWPNSMDFCDMGVFNLLATDPDAWIPTFTFVGNKRVIGCAYDTGNQYDSPIELKLLRRYSHTMPFWMYNVHVGNDELYFAIERVCDRRDPINLDPDKIVRC